MVINAEKLLAEVRTNHSRLDGCDRHEFNPDEYVPAKRMKCLKCGGEMQPVRIADYIRGYEAHGGDPDDIFKGYRNK